MSKLHTIAAALALAMTLGACASTPGGPHGAMPGAALSGSLAAQDRVHTAMEFLHRGEESRARAQLEAALRREPGNVTAQRLLDEINTDPRRQLGERSHAYMVRESDTMTSLAERFVGDPLMFYALARYNNMTPNDLASGQTIQVPDRGRPVPTAAVRAPSAAPAPSVVTPVPSVATTLPPAAAPANADAAQRANRLRLQGLERLNAGDVDHAVVLLAQAHAMDADSAAIQNDLSRAQRIQATLRAQ